MTVANDPSIVQDPVPLGITAQINFVIYSDRLLTTVSDLTGKAIKGWVKDPGGSWVEYTGTIDAAASGTAHITLATANHSTTGTAELRVYVDGELCYPRYEFDFIEEAT